MRTFRLFLYATLALLMLGCAPSSQKNNQAQHDPLNQWNEGTAKASILLFMKAITDEGSPGFIAVPNRVAVFDMDGTILPEKPNPVNFDVIISLLAQQMTINPELTKKQPYKAIHEQDWNYFARLGSFGDDSLYSIMLKATNGSTEDQIRDFITDFLHRTTDKRFNKPFDQLFYVPIVQLVRYLQDNQFEVYIVSGSDPQFTRALSEKAMNIPVQNVIGTTILTKWVETDTGSYFIRVNEFVMPINNEGGKPVNIFNRIGRIPVVAVGNSAGDYHMLEYSKNAQVSLQMIVNHDDSVREYNYDADQMKKMCLDHGWKEISMKHDFKVIFDN